MLIQHFEAFVNSLNEEIHLSLHIGIGVSLLSDHAIAMYIFDLI